MMCFEDRRRATANGAEEKPENESPFKLPEGSSAANTLL